MIQFSRGRLAIIIPLQADWVSSLSSPPASLELATRLPLRGTSGQVAGRRKVMKTKKIMIIPGPDPWPRPGMARCGDAK